MQKEHTPFFYAQNCVQNALALRASLEWRMGRTERYLGKFI